MVVADGVARGEGDEVEVLTSRARVVQPRAVALLEIEHEVEAARQAKDEQPDASDQSLADELREESFLLADTDTALLAQVRAALKRIEDGTFGKCVVDGGPIEEKRLEAVPWTPYCVKHQEELEQATPVRTPKL